ncbi:MULTISPECIES: three-helix bundle dimerization domain-containing protein [unclassified Geodermatophilus]|uniref:three-helix bundle dimerization domain-containing protein n=1 Tax=unclassified Geodermatophilus TaxID=2637632 RepID=UPI003EEA6AB3
MTVTATVVVAEDDDPLNGLVPVAASFVDSLVGRLHAEYGVDRHEIRRLATEVLETFATARVQAFVPILVEKKLRDTYRALRHRGGTPQSGGAPDVRPGPPADTDRHHR